MRNEYNEIKLKNDNVPANTSAYAYTVKEQHSEKEVTEVTETGDVKHSTAITKVSKATTKVLSVAGILTVATSVAAVVTAEEIDKVALTAPEISIVEVWAYDGYTDDENESYMATVEFVMDGDRSDIESFEYYLEDEDGVKTYFTAEEVEDDYFIAEIVFDEAYYPMYDFYGRLYLVISATTTAGWQGEIYNSKIVVGVDFPSYPEIRAATIIQYSDCIMAVVNYCDYSYIWMMELVATITDANGITESVNLTGEYADYSVLEDDNSYMAFFNFYETFTLFEDGTLHLSIIATFYEEGGGLNVYDEEVYSAYLTLTDDTAYG